MSAELGGPRPDQQLNTQSERDPRSFVTFVYRGDNLYMRFLVDGFKAKGIPTISREVSHEDLDAHFDAVKQEPKDKQASALKSFIEPLQGVVVTDITFDNVFANVLRTRTPFGHSTVNAYDALEWDEGGEQDVVAALGPVVEQITASGKKPVALRENLGDHVRFHAAPGEIKREREAERAENQKKYASILQRNFDVPAIDSSRTILNSLREMGVSPKDTVLLIDHHIDLTWKGERIDTQALGEKGIELALVCPCCLKLNAPIPPEMEGSQTVYQRGYKRLGFNFFPLDKPKPNDQIILERLIQMAKEKGLAVPLEEIEDKSQESITSTQPIPTRPASVPEAKPQAEKERISFLRRALGRFGGKK